VQIGARQGASIPRFTFTHTGSLLSVDCAMHQLNQGLQMSSDDKPNFGDQVSLNSTHGSALIALVCGLHCSATQKSA